MDFTTGLTNLNTILGDSGDVTFSSAEKTRALTKAWNDDMLFIEKWDTSLTYTQGTYQYAIPVALTALRDIFISPSGSTQPFPEPISNDLWLLVAGNIQFAQRADWTIPNGFVLYLKGKYKLATTDSITDTQMQEYVLSLAGYHTLGLLSHKKANLFVKNDTQMSELIALRRELAVEIREYRARLPKAFESA